MLVDFDMIDNTEKKTYFHQYFKKLNRSSLCNVAVQFTVQQSPCCTDPAWAEAVSPCVTQHGQFVTRSCALDPSRIKLRKISETMSNMSGGRWNSPAQNADAFMSSNGASCCQAISYNSHRWRKQGTSLFYLFRQKVTFSQQSCALFSYRG